jgi:hypothetical protein
MRPPTNEEIEEWLAATFLQFVGPAYAWQPFLQVANDNGTGQRDTRPQGDPEGTEGR